MDGIAKETGVLGAVVPAMLVGLMVLVSAPAAGQDRVRVGAFEIDRTEVTIGAFRQFADATGTRTAAEKAGGGFEWGAGWERRAGWTVYTPYGRSDVREDEPAVHVSWQEAVAFCRWRGGRLPTAKEWRLAAYSEMRSQPGEGLKTGETYAYPVGQLPKGMNTQGDDPWPRHAPAGVTRPGVNGLYDMGGNVWEWLADRRDGEALTAGGSWWYGAHKTRSEGLQYKPADFYAVYVGFRCAYDPK